MNNKPPSPLHPFCFEQDLGIDTVAFKLRTHAEKENSWQNQENYDLPTDS